MEIFLGYLPLASPKLISQKMQKSRKIKIYSDHGIRTQEDKKGSTRYFRPNKCYLIYLWKYELWPPISRVPGGLSKNGKISKQEPIYGLSIGAGLIWI